MKFFQDMSEVPLYPMEDLSLSHENPSDCNPSDPLELESSTEFSLLSKPSYSDSSNLVTFPTDPYAALPSPLPLLYPWSPSELCPPLKAEAEEKPKKVARSKGIRKIDAERKKTIKQMRNRISAQKSRDRKKKEVDDLKEEAERLRQENTALRSQLQAATGELEKLRKIVDQGPVQKLKENIDHKPRKMSKASHKRGHLLLTTFVIGCLCFAACMNPLAADVGKAAPLGGLGLPKVEVQTPEIPKESRLTPAQKARRDYIERNSKLNKDQALEESKLEKIEELLEKNGSRVEGMILGNLELKKAELLAREEASLLTEIGVIIKKEEGMERAFVQGLFFVTHIHTLYSQYVFITLPIFLCI
eukprot:TRINITY_DN2486_c0_g1_i1.p1 TRINITY_DN2486_c0_g1~~TRINITY_DN2486_c0_g1_i1.p1  ORF type:complete len:360 (-),score=50.34 TRINITY_DN2486_c0_g1_i1:51-1130(-)